MSQTRKPVTESGLLEWLQQLGDGFPPITITAVQSPFQGTQGGKEGQADALIDIAWREKEYRFAVEIKALSTPKSLDMAVLQVRRASQWLGLYPLVVTTYLSEDNLRWLEREEVSGLDCCGNGIIVIPGELLLWRSGASNKYPRGTTIQNVYRGSSSLAARAFLLKPRYDSVQELLAEIHRRGGATTLATVSKVSAVLAEDLIIDRQKINRTTRLKLLQPAKLLDTLSSNFLPPVVGKRWLGKCSMTGTPLNDILNTWQIETGARIARSGADSTERYATMAREPVARFYCTRIAALLNVLGAQLTETTRFPNIELLETTDPTLYFDVRDDFTASPLQCLLELQAGDKRDQETAQQVRRLILRGTNDQGNAS
jgi:hypothetical protein